MTTDKYLSQISRIDHAIANKLEEIKKLSDMATSISISPKEVDVQSSGNPDKMGSAVSKIVDLQNEIQALVDELVDKRTIVHNLSQHFPKLAWYTKRVEKQNPTTPKSI